MATLAVLMLACLAVLSILATIHPIYIASTVVLLSSEPAIEAASVTPPAIVAAIQRATVGRPYSSPEVHALYVAGDTRLASLDAVRAARTSRYLARINACSAPTVEAVIKPRPVMVEPETPSQHMIKAARFIADRYQDLYNEGFRPLDTPMGEIKTRSGVKWDRLLYACMDVTPSC